MRVSVPRPPHLSMWQHFLREAPSLQSPGLAGNPLPSPAPCLRSLQPPPAPTLEPLPHLPIRPLKPPLPHDTQGCLYTYQITPRCPAQLPPRPTSHLTRNAESVQQQRPGSSPHTPSAGPRSHSSHTSSCVGPPHAGALLPQGLCTCCSPCLDPLPPVALRLTLRLLLGLCPDVPGPWALLTLPYETTRWAVASRLSLARPWYESTLRFRAPSPRLGTGSPSCSRPWP